jgi:hypothetical protein
MSYCQCGDQRQPGGLPNITYEPQKPKPLGAMFKNGVEAVIGIVIYQDVMEMSEAQASKKYAGNLSNPQACH